jgi:SAM-dependent methyltransferase
VTEPEQVVDWDAIYQQKFAGLDGPPGWNIGEPQPELAELMRQGKFRSEVLDAGCGFAEGSLYLAAQGYTVVGVDLTPTAIAAATAAAAERGLTTATYVQADITNLRGYDGRFATVMDSGLLHALPVELRDAYLTSIHRAAAPGAMLFILAFAQGAFPAPPPGGPKAFTEDELRDAVAQRWIVDDIRPAFLHAHVPDGLPLPDEVARDDKGRVKGPAWLLTGHKAI